MAKRFGWGEGEEGGRFMGPARWRKLGWRGGFEGYAGKAGEGAPWSDAAGMLTGLV